MQWPFLLLTVQQVWSHGGELLGALRETPPRIDVQSAFALGAGADVACSSRLEEGTLASRRCVMGRAALVMTVVFVGCGAPQSPLDAGAQNHPPRILETAPALRSTWYATNACPSLNATFRLTVEDLDGDVLHSLWLIDPAPASASWPTSPVAGDAVKRAVTSPSALSFRSTLANLPIGVHLVTAWVADADFNEVVDGSVTVTGAGATDSYTWVLDVEPCP